MSRCREFKMKNALIISLIMLTVMLTLPLGSLERTAPAVNTSALPIEDITAAAVAPAAYKSFKIKLSKSGEIKEIPAEEYLFGVVAGEMPAEYEEEALKAQALAAYSFACCRKAHTKTEYDLTDNPQTDQCYITEAEAREKWGDGADGYAEKIKNAVTAVSGMLVMYNGTTALTVYHAISSGKTESSADVWGSEVAYLTSVDSSWDKTAAGYLSECQLSDSEVAEKLSAIADTSGERENRFCDAELSPAGRVKSISYCGKRLSGGEVAAALGLRSACFEVTAEENGFKFTVRGYGHGVGMSQNGANYMAKQGSSFEEILAHYYPECVVMKEKQS